MTGDMLRLFGAGLAMFTSGATLVVLVRYLISAWRMGRSPSRIRARHVTEVAGGTFQQTLATGWALYDTIDKTVHPTASITRVVLWTIGMLLLMVGVIEVGVFQRRRDEPEPEHGRHELREDPDR